MLLSFNKKVAPTTPIVSAKVKGNRITLFSFPDQMHHHFCLYRFTNLTDATNHTNFTVVDDEIFGLTFLDDNPLVIGNGYYYTYTSVDIRGNESIKSLPASATYRAIQTADIEDNAVTTPNIASNAVTTAKVADNAIDAAKIAAASINASKFATGVAPVEIFASLPVTGNFEGRQVYLTTDKKLYRYNGSAFIASIATADLSGTITDAQIAAVATTKLTGTISSAQIANAAITTTKFASGLTPVEVLGVLPTVGNFDGRQVYLTTDKKLYRHNGTSFIASVAATDLSGQITSAQITDAAITATKFASGLTPVEIVGTLPVTGNFDGRQVYLTTDKKLYRYNGTAFVATIASTDLTGTLTDAQLTAISAAKITGQVSTTQIADSAITLAKFAAGIEPVEIFASLPVTGNFDGRQVYLTTDKKLYRYNGSAFISSVAATDVSGQITTTQITDDAITTAKVAANAITAAEIAANTITAGQIAAGTITATQIAANTITANKLILADTSNMADMGWSRGDISAWTRQNQLNFYSSVGEGDASGWVYQSIGRDQAQSIYFPVTPGETYYFDVWVHQTDTTRAQILAHGLTPAGVHSFPTVAFTDVKNTWTRMTGQYTVAAGVTQLAMLLQNERTAGVGTACYWSKPIMRRAASAELIVDGSVIAAKLAANSVVAGKIAAGTIVAADIAASTITGAKIAAGTITAANIAADTITAGQIAAGAITASEVAAGAITTTHMTANTINGDRIAAGTIAADKIVANSITAGQIATGAIAADEIAAGAITAAKLAVGNGANYIKNSDMLAGTANWKLYGTTNAANFTFGIRTDTYAAGGAAIEVRQINNVASQYYDICPALPDGSTEYYTVTGNKWYELSAYTYGHRSDGVNLYVQWIDGAGAHISYSTPVLGLANQNGTPIKQLSVYARPWTKLQAPSNAAFAVVFFRCEGTIVGQADSYNWIKRPFFAECNVNQTEPTPWSEGGTTVIGNGNITTNSINGDRITANTLNASKIVAGSITTDRMTANSIHGDRITAGTITADKIVANSITAGQIASGAIATDELAAGSVVASKLFIGDSSNIFVDPPMADGTYFSAWTGGTSRPIQREDNSLGASRYKMAVVSAFTETITMYTKSSPVDANKPYYFSVTAISENAVSTTFTAIASWLAVSSTGVETWISDTVIGTGTTTSNLTFSTTAPIIAPANARAVQIYLTKGVTGSAGRFSMASPIIRRANNGELIVDGTITASKITVGSLSALSATLGAVDISSAIIGTLTVNSVNLGPNVVLPSKIRPRNFTNLARDPDMLELSNYSCVDGTGFARVYTSSLSRSAFGVQATFNPSVLTSAFRSGIDTPIEQGRRYRYRGVVQPTATVTGTVTATPFVEWWYTDSNGNPVALLSTSTGSSVTFTGTARMEFDQIFTADSLVQVARFGVKIQSATSQTTTVTWDSVDFSDVVEGADIGNDTITYSKIATDAVRAYHIADGEITFRSNSGSTTPVSLGANATVTAFTDTMYIGDQRINGMEVMFAARNVSGTGAHTWDVVLESNYTGSYTTIANFPNQAVAVNGWCIAFCSTTFAIPDDNAAFNIRARITNDGVAANVSNTKLSVVIHRR